MGQKHRFRVAENLDRLLERFDRFEERISQKIRENPVYRAFYPFLRGAIIFFVYALILTLAVRLLSDNLYLHAVDFLSFPRQTLAVMTILLTILTAQSVIKIFTVYSHTARKNYLQRRATVEFEEEERKHILSQTHFWIEVAMFWGLCILTPTAWAGHNAILSLLPQVNTWHPILQKLLTLPIPLAASFLLQLRARLKAIDTWEEALEKGSKRIRLKTKKRKKESAFSYFRMLFKLILHTVIVALIAGFAPRALAFSISFGRLFVMFFSIQWLRIVFYVLFALLVLRIYWKRIRLLGRFKKLCRENGFQIFYRRRLLFSALFSSGKGYHLGIEANGKLYCCRFLPCLRRGNDMYLASHSGKCTRVFAFRLRMPVVAKAGGYAMMSKDNADPTELFSFISSTHKYTFEAEEKAQKILLLNPVPIKVYRTSIDVISPQTSEELDNGMDVGEYKIFTGGAFLRALERDSVEIMKKKEKY